jgi:hypothetical protein
LEEFAAMTLLELDQTVEKKRLRRLLETPGYRFMLMEWLLEHERTGGFPKKLFSEENRARVDLEEQLFREYDEIPTEIAFHDVMNVFYGGETQSLYVFKVGMPSAQSWITGFSGPFLKTGGTEVLERELTGTQGERFTGNPSEIRKQVREWIDLFEEEIVEE